MTVTASVSPARRAVISSRAIEPALPCAYPAKRTALPPDEHFPIFRLKTPMTAAALPPALEHTLRLMYPFWLDAGPLEKRVDALCQWRQVVNAKTTARKTWFEPQKIPALYQDETVPFVAQVLFGIRYGANRYLQVDAQTVRQWLPDSGVFAAKTNGAAQGTPHYPAQPAGEGIELFLSPQGVGVLVLTLTVPAGTADALLTCTHRLSQWSRGSALHYASDAAALRTDTPAAPIEQRLGAANALFLLAELVDYLLTPLHPFGLYEMQRRFSVYSVTRFDAGVQFATAEAHARFQALLTGLAHVEAATATAGAQIGERILTAGHWAAVGSLGAAHLVTDPQAGARYFVAHISALLQRQTLQRLLWAIDQAAMDSEGSLAERQTRLRLLQQEVLRFSVQGCFIDISTEDARNQYYALALAGLRVEASWQAVQQALQAMAAATALTLPPAAAAREASGAPPAARPPLNSITGGGSPPRGLSVLLLAFCATALVRYIGDGVFAQNYQHWSVIAAPFVAAGGAGLAALPWGDAARQRRGVGWLFAAAALLAGWIGVGWVYFPAEKQVIQGQSFLCAAQTTRVIPPQHQSGAGLIHNIS